ncbi:MAG TPA: aminotransferase class IV [Chitinophagaceae bacterium]|nr:aminotransferase class IV [Chitinophagaceae bacterium]HQV87027.1 aminotransferase class IV [Chitinophagaceae bacterium]HQX71770.1 aminotransferase class IV [Chitinophagaceae bacterium]
MFICLNGKILRAEDPVLLASNRGYRYGDALFETMKVASKNILLEAYHFERLFAGLRLLQFEVPKLLTREKLCKEVLLLAEKNHCGNLARIRLSVFRGNGGVYDEERTPQYLIECWPLNESLNRLNENGLIIDVFPAARKSCDSFSHLKSANYLPYTMAAIYAKANKLNDCLVLNTDGNIADATIANVFLIKEGVVITPGPDQGCVNGVMRRHLLEKMKDAGYSIQENPVSVSTLEEADEVFLTNAISGIRWVKQFRDNVYSNNLTVEIYNRFIKTIPA